MNKSYPAKINTIFLFVLFLMVQSVLYAQAVKNPYFTMPEGISKNDYLDGKIIFKMKAETSPYLKSHSIDMEIFGSTLKQLNAGGPEKMFPIHLPPVKSLHSSGQKYSDLSRIFHVDIPSDVSLEDAINTLYATNLVEYAQPWYLPQSFSSPNDPFTGSQYYLEKIGAYDAWSIAQGDTNVVIAIIDTGIDLLHPDLIHNIAYNYDDLINGEDSDNDGYIDNFRGWDLGGNDNNPQWDVNAHGVHVAGIAGATTNNGTGMAGVGYKSRLLPIKISDADGRLVRSYEGIVYAADQGAKVINCSWGGAISPGQFGQDIINYAVLNKDAVVVGAAGNSNNQVRIYPASFVNALSVAATGNTDLKWSGSSFGKLVDLSAPGENIFSTWPNGSYVASSGTSMAAPVVSGAAALLRAHYPHYNALQIIAQLKITTDLIDTIPANIPFTGLMGTGRLNIHRALTETHHPYLMFKGLQYPMEHYQMFNPGETFNLGTEFLNLLATAENLYAELSTQSQFIEIISNQSPLGRIESNQTANNFNNPFTVKIKENIPPSKEETFTIRFYNQEGVYAGQQNFTMTFNLDYIDFASGIIQTTINSRGNIGYNYPNFNQGVGFLYASANLNRSLVSCAGLVTGTSTSSVVDNIYGPIENSFTNSFFSIENARLVANPEKGNLMIKGSFNDSLAGNFKIGMKVDYRIYAFEETPLDKFLIMEYDVINISSESKPGFYAGYYADWAIQDVRNHRAAFDPENKMGYAFSANGGNLIGIQLLSHSTMKHYAFDNQGFGGSLKISDGFTSFEKYTAMKSNRDNAGFFDKDNDISTLISTGPFNFQPNDTIKLAFAMVVGDHLNDLQSNAKMAALAYNGVFMNTELITPQNPFSLKVYPNPVTSHLVAEFSNATAANAEISVFDIQTRQIYSQVLNQNPHELTQHFIDTSAWQAGLYILQIKTSENVQSIRFIKN